MFMFELYGPLVVQKQTRFRCINGIPIGYDPSKKDLEHIRWQIKPFAPKEPLCCPVELTIAFYFPIPKATSNVKRLAMINQVILPDVRPDEDNLAYIVTNALKNIVYDDDKRVCAKHVYKFYGKEPKTVIKVRPILQSQQVGIHDNL